MYNHPAIMPATSCPASDHADAALALVNLAADLEEGRRPDPAAVALLSGAIARWLGEGVPLERGLGLRGGIGVETARTQLQRRERDRHLRRAHEMCEGESPWAKTLALSQELDKFERRFWPAWRDLPAPPAGTSELRAAIFHATRAWRLPRLRQLHSICANNGRF